MTFAINWDVTNDPAWYAITPAEVALYFGGVRLRSRRGWATRIEDVVDAGMEVCAVIEWESEGWIHPQTTWAQVLNEMTSGSAPMTAAAYARQWRAVREQNPDFQGSWMTGGLARGADYDIAWLGRFLRAIPKYLYPNALAIHVYTLEPDQVQAYCDRVYNTFGIPAVVTEWWRSAAEGHHPMQCVLGGEGLDGQGPRSPLWNSYFCLSSHMTHDQEGRDMGLLDIYDNQTDEWWSLLSAPENCRR